MASADRINTKNCMYLVASERFSPDNTQEAISRVKRTVVHMNISTINKMTKNVLLYTFSLLSLFFWRYRKKVVSIPKAIIAFRMAAQAYTVVKIPYTPAGYFLTKRGVNTKLNNLAMTVLKPYISVCPANFLRVDKFILFNHNYFSISKLR